VARVIDGDTLFFANGEYVRLDGVDTPETKHPEKPVEYFRKEACQFTRGMAEGKEVWLEYV
jgi:micrococcal nuclease